MPDIQSSFTSRRLWVLKDSSGNLRNGWWISIFILSLSVGVLLLIFSADRFKFEISTWHQLIIIIAASVFCQLLRQKPISEISGRIDKDWLKDSFAGFIIGTTLMILPALILTLFGFIEWKFNWTFSNSFFSITASMIAVALAEEWLFRGFVFQRLISGTGIWPAQLIVSFFFLLTHLNNPGMIGTMKIIASINIFVASILFGIAFIKTRKLAMPIAMHLAANVMQGPILGFGVSGNEQEGLLTPIFQTGNSVLTGGEFGLEASIVSLAVLILITLWCIRDNTDRMLKRSMRTLQSPEIEK